MTSRWTLGLAVMAIANVCLLLSGAMPPVGFALCLAILVLECAKLLFLVFVLRRSSQQNIFPWMLIAEGVTFLLAVVLALKLVPTDSVIVPLAAGLEFVLGRVFAGLALGDCFSEKN